MNIMKNVLQHITDWFKDLFDNLLAYFFFGLGWITVVAMIVALLVKLVTNFSSVDVVFLTLGGAAFVAVVIGKSFCDFLDWLGRRIP
jgi:hypothetical protein